MQLGLTSTFRIWGQYLLIGVGALMTSVLALFAISKGVSETTAIISAAMLTVVLVFTIWQLQTRRGNLLKRHPVAVPLILCVVGILLAVLLLYLYDPAWVIPSLIIVIFTPCVVGLTVLFVVDFILPAIGDSLRRPIT